MRHSFTLIFYDGRKVCVGPEGVGRARHVRKRNGRKVSLKVCEDGVGLLTEHGGSKDAHAHWIRIASTWDIKLHEA